MPLESWSRRRGWGYRTEDLAAIDPLNTTWVETKRFAATFLVWLCLGLPPNCPVSLGGPQNVIEPARISNSNSAGPPTFVGQRAGEEWGAEATRLGSVGQKLI